jgi:hypothetical protein
VSGGGWGSVNDWRIQYNANVSLRVPPKIVEDARSKSKSLLRAEGGNQIEVASFDLFFSASPPDALVKLASFAVQRKGTFKHDLFISYYQITGGDVAATLRFRLEKQQLSVLMDQAMAQINTTSMEKGVEESMGVILLLTKGVLSRPFCQMEIRKALALKKRVVMVHEPEPRMPGFAEIYEMKQEAPLDLQVLFDQIESIPYRRRDFEVDGMVKQICARLGLLGG